MLEIAPQVFIERDYPGVTLGLINWPMGVILIDAPFRPDDIRLWRISMQTFNGSTDRLLISLDDHYDRTLGSRQIECTVIGHDKLAQCLKDRPVNLRPQGLETGAEWEMHNSLGNVRWSSPEITFTDHMEIHWDKNTLLLDARPGPSPAAIWATLPSEKLIFVGDAVMPESVPFLGSADLDQWMEALSSLLKPEFRAYQIISGRDGLLGQAEVKAQLKVLEKISKQLEKFTSQPLRNEEIQKAASHILKDCDVPKAKELQNLQRARYGIAQYLRRTTGAQLEQPSAF
jgi:glyoxylase-like metal-dependent hydrolase (beta-lactamase superfamily II)